MGEFYRTCLQYDPQNEEATAFVQILAQERSVSKATSRGRFSMISNSTRGHFELDSEADEELERGQDEDATKPFGTDSDYQSFYQHSSPSAEGRRRTTSSMT